MKNIKSFSLPTLRFRSMANSSIHRVVAAVCVGALALLLHSSGSTTEMPGVGTGTSARAASVEEGCLTASGVTSTKAGGHAACEGGLRDEEGRPQPDAGATASLYVCPMPPQIAAEQPGDCPVCGMHLSRVGGQDHEGAAAEQNGAVYTCPMHPQIQAAQPGDCPLCGMHLRLATTE